jgi:hypothetical protein
MTSKRLKDMAHGYLTMTVRGDCGVTDDGVAARVRQLAFNAGAKIIGDGEDWQISGFGTHYIHPGHANYVLGVEALNEGRLVFTCERIDELFENLESENPEPEAFDALVLIATTMLEQCRPFPNRLFQWAAENFTKPNHSNRTGPKASGNLLRNKAIVGAVYWMKLSEPDLPDRAIFRAVAHALEEIEFPKGRKFQGGWDAIRKIWDHVRKELESVEKLTT